MVTDYDAFIKENRKRINKLINTFKPYTGFKDNNEDFLQEVYVTLFESKDEEDFWISLKQNFRRMTKRGVPQIKEAENEPIALAEKETPESIAIQKEETELIKKDFSNTQTTLIFVTLLSQLIDKFLQCLSKKEKEIWTLLFEFQLEQEPAEEYRMKNFLNFLKSKSVKIKRGAVYSRLNRGIERFKKIWETSGIDFAILDLKNNFENFDYDENTYNDNEYYEENIRIRRVI